MLDAIVLVHGGAGDIPDFRVGPKLEGVRKAAMRGYEVLTKEGGTVLDAVEAAVCIMEDLPAFNAGRGSLLNINGEVEMDAMIMEGQNLNAGAVAVVQNIQYPVKMARLVMEKTDHVMIAGTGTDIFAKEMGIPLVSSDWLITEYAQKALENFKHHGIGKTEVGHEEHGTVGAVAINSSGQMASATSTGGKTGRRVGRVGDVPIPGAGGYCDDEIGAVSTTGDGEAIMTVCLSKHIIQLIEAGKTAQQATVEALDNLKQKTEGTAGAITLDCKGNIGCFWNSRRMAWAYQKKNKLYYGIEHDKVQEETVPGDNMECK